jgi:hypothetical protein
MNALSAPWLLPAITATAQIASVVAVFVVVLWGARVLLWERWEHARFKRRNEKRLRARVQSSAAPTQNVTLIPRVFDWARDEAL